jgi:hypothetical protein
MLLLEFSATTGGKVFVVVGVLSNNQRDAIEDFKEVFHYCISLIVGDSSTTLTTGNSNINKSSSHITKCLIYNGNQILL